MLGKSAYFHKPLVMSRNYKTEYRKWNSQVNKHSFWVMAAGDLEPEFSAPGHFSDPSVEMSASFTHRKIEDSLISPSVRLVRDGLYQY
jgi:hypothetical protein